MGYLEMTATRSRHLVQQTSFKGIGSVLKASIEAIPQFGELSHGAMFPCTWSHRAVIMSEGKGGQVRARVRIAGLHL